MPFLVQTAQEPASDAPSTSPAEAVAGPFHTRCGHPRRRDD